MSDDPATTSGASATTRGSIMVVEDDEDLRETMAEILRAAGYAVATAAHGAQALDRLRRDSLTPPCLIILDMMMPVMNGWEFRRAQLDDAALAAIPVVVLTGDARADEKGDALRAAGSVAKPISIEALLGMVGQYCQ